jgi:hypothetical protein
MNRLAGSDEDFGYDRSIFVGWVQRSETQQKWGARDMRMEMLGYAAWKGWEKLRCWSQRKWQVRKAESLIRSTQPTQIVMAVCTL